MNNIPYKTLILKSILILFLSVVAGLLLLSLVHMLPTAEMDKNMYSSAELISKEGLYPDSLSPGFAIEDNWTDAIMLGIAVYDTNDSVMNSAMAAAREMCNSGIPTESIVNHYIYNQSSSWTENYERYWHGYLASLKPLLMITDYQGIRTINLLLQSLMLIAILILLYKSNHRHIIVPYLLCAASLRLISMANCISYSANYYIALAASLAIILQSRRNTSDEKYLYIFLLSGIATAYLDLLKYPIITFGIPCILFISIKKPQSLKDQIRFLLLSGILWLIGYGIMWASKWLVGSVITGNNYFSNAIERMGEVSGNNSVKLPLSSVLHSNLHDYLYSPVIGAAVLYSIFLVIQIIHYSRGTIKLKNTLALLNESSLLVYLALILLPFVYILAMKQHVGIHSFFENKVLCICLYSGLSLLSCIKYNLSTK